MSAKIIQAPVGSGMSVECCQQHTEVERVLTLLSIEGLTALISEGARVVEHPTDATHFYSVKKDGREYDVYVDAK